MELVYDHVHTLKFIFLFEVQRNNLTIFIFDFMSVRYLLATWMIEIMNNYYINFAINTLNCLVNIINAIAKYMNVKQKMRIVHFCFKIRVFNVANIFRKK